MKKVAIEVKTVKMIDCILQNTLDKNMAMKKKHLELIKVRKLYNDYRRTLEIRNEHYMLQKRITDTILGLNHTIVMYEIILGRPSLSMRASHNTVRPQTFMRYLRK